MPLTPRAFFLVVVVVLVSHILQFNYMLKGSMIFLERNNISHCLIVFTQWHLNDIQHPFKPWICLYAMQYAYCTHKDTNGIIQRLVHSINPMHRKRTVEFHFHFSLFVCRSVDMFEVKRYAKCIAFNYGIIMWNGTTFSNTKYSECHILPHRFANLKNNLESNENNLQIQKVVTEFKTYQFSN